MVVKRLPKRVVIVCALLLALAAAPAMAQVLQLIALTPGDDLSVNCPTTLVAVSGGDNSQLLSCALVGAERRGGR